MGFGISVSCFGQCLVNVESFFVVVIGLVWYIDYGDDWLFDWLVGVGGDGFINYFCQCLVFQQVDFVVGGVWVVVVSIWDYGDKMYVFVINLVVCYLDGRVQVVYQWYVGCQFVQLQCGVVWELIYYLFFWVKSCLICVVFVCWWVLNWFK